MGFSLDAAKAVAALYRDARAARAPLSQDAAAEGATACLVKAVEDGRRWTSGLPEIVVERHFVARIETTGVNPLISVGTMARSRALAEFLGLDWLRQVLPAAQAFHLEDLGAAGNQEGKASSGNARARR